MKYLVIFLLFFNTILFSQSKDTIVSSKYLEDQIYVGLSYITLYNLPDDVSSNGFSNSLAFGFIKDIPFDENGNFGFGVGLGYGRNTYYQNIKISESDNQTSFEAVKGIFNNNKFSVHAIEFPLELRWRTSTIDKYKFYRIYAGGKISYAFATNARFKESGNTIRVKNISEFNKFHYGLTLSLGYGTWNFNFYYGLNDIFKNAKLDDVTPLKIRDFRIGLIFYVL